MKSKVTAFGHALHPILVSFPIAFYSAATVCYIVYAFETAPLWFYMGYCANVAGVAMAVLAAVPGLADWQKIIPDNSDAKRIGRNHMILQISALLMFMANAWLQTDDWNKFPPVGEGSIILSVIGMLCTVMGAYLGGTLVESYHVSVDEPGQPVIPLTKTEPTPFRKTSSF